MIPAQLVPTIQRLLLLLLVGLLAGCGGRSTTLIRDPLEVDELPPWIGDVALHPVHAPPAYLAATALSSEGLDGAERAARRILEADIRTRIDRVLRRARPVHPYFSVGEAFDERVATALRSDGALLRRVMRATVSDTASQGRYGPRTFALVYLERAEVDSVLARRAAVLDEWVAEAVTIATRHAELDDWFDFVRWSGTALSREADRVATLAAWDAVGSPSPRPAFTASEELLVLRDHARALAEGHGWTLRVDFEWENAASPGLLEPRIQQRLMRVLLESGFQVGLGVGCPRRVRRVVDEDDPDAVPEPPRPHHVLRVGVRGTARRTPLGAWDAELRFTGEARTCGVGTRIQPHEMGALTGTHDLDPDSALLRALQFGDLDGLADAAFREMGLILPVELLLGVSG